MAAAEGDADEPVAVPAAISPEAEADIREAYQYYEDQAEGLGLEFARAVDARLAGVERFPGMYAVAHGQVRRASLNRFPYSLFYVVEGGRVEVLACFHASRDPRQWPRRG